MNTTEIPQLQVFRLNGVKHILPEDAYDALNEKKAVVIDVREKYETISYIETARFYPMWQMKEWLPGISADENYIILCNKGIRSSHVVKFLQDNGFSNAVNLDGGFEAWKSRGLPYKTGFRRG